MKVIGITEDEYNGIDKREDTYFINDCIFDTNTNNLIAFRFEFAEPRYYKLNTKDDCCDYEELVRAYNEVNIKSFKQETKILDLQIQIERMKVCANCQFALNEDCKRKSVYMPNLRCDKWEMKTID